MAVTAKDDNQASTEDKGCVTTTTDWVVTFRLPRKTVFAVTAEDPDNHVLCDDLSVSMTVSSPAAWAGSAAERRSDYFYLVPLNEKE